MKKRRVPLRTFAVSLVLAATALAVQADPTTPALFTEITMGASPEEVRDSLGPPAFAEEPILMYSRQLLTADGMATADLTLWFSSDRLFFASYAFSVEGIDPTDLTARFDQVSSILAEAFLEPSSRASTPGSYITEVWTLDDLDIEHTLIVNTGRTEHVVTMTAGPQKTAY